MAIAGTKCFLFMEKYSYMSAVVLKNNFPLFTRDRRGNWRSLRALQESASPSNASFSWPSDRLAPILHLQICSVSGYSLCTLHRATFPGFLSWWWFAWEDLLDKKLRMASYGSVVIYSGRYKINPSIEKRSYLKLTVDQTDQRASRRHGSKTERLENSKGTIVYLYKLYNIIYKKFNSFSQINLPSSNSAIPGVSKILCVFWICFVWIVLDELCDNVLFAKAQSDEGLALLERLDRAVLTSSASCERTENK